MTIKNLRNALARLSLATLFAVSFSQTSIAEDSTTTQKVLEQLNEILDAGEFNNNSLYSQLKLETPTPFIIDGVNAGRNVFPEFTLIILTDGRGNIEGICGGALIASNRVLTAAHCSQARTSTYFTIPGFYTFNDRLRARDLVQVASIVNHPNYTSASFDFDVAVMTIRRKTNIPPAKLVKGNSKLIGKEGNSIGVGLTATEPSPQPATILQRVAVPIVSNLICGTVFDILSNSNPITPNMLCAGFLDNPAGTCSGDSGSPLFVDIDGERVIAGTVSFGFQTCEANRATSVFARTSAYTEFIATQSPLSQFIEVNQAPLTSVYQLLLD